jgi:hypothetical protein
MITRENELPSYSLVESALKAIANWVTQSQRDRLQQ